MSLHPNAAFLRDHLERMTTALDGRFSSIRLVNYDPTTGIKRGCFSLVFKAYDNVEQKDVALKFFDPDPQWRSDTYRINSFKREHEILQVLLTRERCLQLACGLKTLIVPVPVVGIGSIDLAFDYFGIEWLDSEIDDFFLLQSASSAVDRLRLFNEIVLAIETLHKHDVFHRDLKADNLRAQQIALKRIVVAIDLGTAARYDSGCIKPSYGGPVGARAYAAPESICGLAGNRAVAKFTDVYALGCLLYELFNPDYFFTALRNANPTFDFRLRAMAQIVATSPNPAQQVIDWNTSVTRLGVGLIHVNIDGMGSSIPPAVGPILNKLLGFMTHFDFKNRKLNFAWIRSRIWAAIRIIENEAAYQRTLTAARQRRQQREALLLQKLARFNGPNRPLGINNAAA